MWACVTRRGFQLRAIGVLGRRCRLRLWYSTQDLIAKQNTRLRKVTRAVELQDKRLHAISQKQESMVDIIDMFLGIYQIPADDKLAIMTPSLNRYPVAKDSMGNLMLLGQKMLKVHCQQYLMTSGSRSRTKVEGIDFDILANGKLPSLDSDALLRKFTEESGIAQAVICRSPMEHAHRLDHSVECLLMLLGCVYKNHGTGVTSHFIRTRVIEGSSGLFQLSLARTDPS